jgi:hypothetical protein
LQWPTEESAIAAYVAIEAQQQNTDAPKPKVITMRKCSLMVDEKKGE